MILNMMNCGKAVMMFWWLGRKMLINTIAECMTITLTRTFSMGKRHVLSNWWNDMFYWKMKLWPFRDDVSTENQRKKMVDWCNKNASKYQIRQIFVQNSWAVEYRDLIKQ